MPWPPPSRMLCVYPAPASAYLGWDSPWDRAGGDCTCEVCGFLYYDHPTPPFFAEIMKDGNPRCGTMVLLCRGEIVKT